MTSMIGFLPSVLSERGRRLSLERIGSNLESDARARGQHFTNPITHPSDQAHIRALWLQGTNGRGMTVTVPNYRINPTQILRNPSSGEHSSGGQECAPQARRDAHIKMPAKLDH